MRKPLLTFANVQFLSPPATCATLWLFQLLNTLTRIESASDLLGALGLTIVAFSLSILAAFVMGGLQAGVVGLVAAAWTAKTNTLPIYVLVFAALACGLVVELVYLLTLGNVQDFLSMLTLWWLGIHVIGAIWGWWLDCKLQGVWK